MSGGIIIQRAKALLVAATDPSIYEQMSDATKAIVNSIDAKDPASRTQDDIDQLLIVLEQTCGC